MMENKDIVYNIAEEFSKLKNYNYVLVLETKDGKPKMKFTIDMSSLSKRFTHISGLEHIDDIEDFNMKNLSAGEKEKKRSRTLKKILSKDITFKTIENKSKLFFKTSTKEYFSFEHTQNPTTGKPYTIIDRLNSQKNIESVFNSLFKGKILQRNHMDKIMGYSKIDAPYVLKYPTSYSSENLYIFFEKDYSHSSKHNKENTMRVSTAFSDKSDLIRNPINTFTVLKISKVKLSNQQPDEVQEIYENQKYTDFLQATTKNNAPMKTEFIKMNFGNERLFNSNTVAVLSRPHFSFGQALSNLINGLAEKIKTGVEERRQELRKAKQENDALKKAIAERDEQLAKKNDEIANLEKECADLSDQLEKQKQLITTAAKPTRSFSQNLDDFAKRVRAENAAKPQSKTDQMHKTDKKR